MLCTRMRLRALQGTIVAATMMVAPWAAAHGSHVGHKRGEAHHHHLVAERHRHHATSASRHRSHHMYAMTEGQRAVAEERAPVDAEARPQRAHLYRADYDAMEERRHWQELNEREAAVTARLNLAELQKGRERDDEIARWKLQYGGSASG